MNKQQEPKPARKRPWRKPRVLLAVAMLRACHCASARVSRL